MEQYWQRYSKIQENQGKPWLVIIIIYYASLIRIGKYYVDHEKNEGDAMAIKNTVYEED